MAGWHGSALWKREALLRRDSLQRVGECWGGEGSGKSRDFQRVQRTQTSESNWSLYFTQVDLLSRFLADMHLHFFCCLQTCSNIISKTLRPHLPLQSPHCIHQWSSKTISIAPSDAWPTSIVRNETSGELIAQLNMHLQGYHQKAGNTIVAVSDEPLCWKGEKNTILHKRKKKGYSWWWKGMHF